MNLEQTINEDIKTAMKSRDAVGLQALRAIKSAILLAKTSGSGADTLDEKEEVAILQRLAKQRRESIAMFEAQDRQDLVSEEKAQLLVIERYLPALMSEDEIREVLKQLIDETEEGMRNMGKLMGAAVKKLAGKADNSKVSALLKDLLDPKS
jgi:uncharacterized protein